MNETDTISYHRERINLTNNIEMWHICPFFSFLFFFCSLRPEESELFPHFTLDHNCADMFPNITHTWPSGDTGKSRLQTSKGLIQPTRYAMWHHICRLRFRFCSALSPTTQPKKKRAPFFFFSFFLSIKLLNSSLALTYHFLVPVTKAEKETCRQEDRRNF